MICPQNNDIELQRTDDTSEGRTMWKSCCLDLDKEFTMYFVKMFILIGMITFFAVELHLSVTCEDKNLFQSLLLLCLGIICPNPKLK